MKVIYKEDVGEMHLVEAGEFVGIIMYVPIGIRLLSIDIERDIPLEIATKIFQRWHQIDQGAEPEFIARALNDALNSELYVAAGVFRVDIYNVWHKFNPSIRHNVAVLNKLELSSVTCSHNITEDRVEYFIDNNLKGWLPIVRKEMT